MSFPRWWVPKWAVLGLGVMLACAALPTPARCATPPRPLTLAEALVMAQRNDLTVVRAAGDARNAGAAVRSAWGAFLPNLSVSAGTTRQLVGTGTTRIDNNGQVVIQSRQPWSSNLGANASLTIFDGGNRFFEMAQAKSNRVAADVNAASTRWQVALNTKQAFFNVLAARETQLASAAQLDQARQQRVDAFARTHAKAATRSDSLRAEISLRNAQLAVTQAAFDLSSANAALARAVGSLEPVTAASDSVETSSLALDDSTLAALVEDAPAVRAARAVRDAAREARKGAWSAYLPAVVASWARSGTGAGDAPVWDPATLSYTGSLRFGLTFPIFDQFGREQQLTQTAVALNDAEASLRDARLGARQALTDGLGGFREASERVASQAATVEAADEDLRVQRERYSLGGSTLLDVLSSQAALDQARRDMIRARYDQRVAKATLEALVGRDL